MDRLLSVSPTGKSAFRRAILDQGKVGDCKAAGSVCALGVSMKSHRALSRVLSSLRVEKKLEEETQKACFSNLQIT